MRIGLVLPKNISKSYLHRLQKLIKIYFKDVGKIILLSSENNPLAISIPAFLDENRFNLDAMVIARDEEENNPNFQWKLNIPVFKTILQGYGGLRLVSGEFNFKQNFFKKIALLNDFAYAPYSYQNNFNVFNDEDEFGFRNDVNYFELKNRDKDHIVIVIFGGSAVYDLASSIPFSKKIENLLNKNSSKKYTVLNFGLYGGNILNDIQNYIQFCFDLNVDYVIEYGGFNEFVEGMYNDSSLIKKDCFYAFCYEAWLEKLSSHKMKFNLKNSPYSIISSYKKRLKQFKEIVNGEFIYILQPYIYSKSNLHKKEKFFLNYYYKNNRYGKFTTMNLKTLYEMFEEEIDIDFHKIFSQFNDKHFLFVDSVHVNDAGSFFVAKKITQFLKEKYGL